MYKKDTPKIAQILNRSSFASCGP